MLSEVEQLGGQGISIGCNVQKAEILDAAVKQDVDRFGQLDGTG